MKKSQLFIGVFVLLAVVSCHSSRKNSLEECPVVAERVQVGDDQVVSCDQRLLKDTVDILLSSLAEEMEIIRLDNKDEALVGNGGVKISDNYILVQNHNQNPFKLFDRKGNFITSVGSYGEGPDEYQNVYDFQLDEKNNRIYILPWQSARLLVFDLEGKPYPSIPLCLRVPKGKFNVDAADSTLAVVLLPFQGLPAVAWTQDLYGNRKNYIEPGHLMAPPDFSNEVYSFHNTPDFDINILCIMPTRVDSLYHYDYKNNRLRPCFTMNFIGDPIPWHGYVELPGYFIGDASFPVETSPNTFTSSPSSVYIIDKNSLKGAYCKFINDYLADTGFWMYSFQDGYYLNNIEPGNLQSTLEDAIRSNELTEEKKSKMTELLKSIEEDDNNYILIAKLKKPASVM